ncbi:DUF2235 domain-containing protein [Rhodobacter sp. Har01]|uniref:phospholipase effector Tle1 domain-containing protein n=1 Tax=Rhodobacter sp. Har01 TaxID=2883999 RepID=UPI001D080FDC|nr:DUF2235 domain-containing protein [Rhodobacter sp. Har01]MCB6178798.1 DUF2235 domain-containing protein [Rhodobacter sp. Har01]
MERDHGPETSGTQMGPVAGRRIVVFADGTGSAFRQQESNVWRLYSLLLKHPGDSDWPQIARYIPGVGTSSVALIRMLDGATGFGVPANVRKLYRFLCWNWRPGDEIFLFGFSRGSFTVRTLAGMLRFQGLMPREIDGRTVSEAEMARNSMGAWYAYRAATAPLMQDGRLAMLPHIAAGRWLRDRLIAAKRRSLGQRTHDEVVAAMPEERQAGAVRVRYMGVFDTVEAYGFPFEFLRVVWSWAIWPITFRNTQCAGIVDRADHPLSLDDERLTFHPLRFDQSHAGTPEAPTVIREPWFAGAHSDVGGGYPDDAVAMDALDWIASAARDEGLEWDEPELQRLVASGYPQALINDSRGGFKVGYRYDPRPKAGGPQHGGTPVLDASVLEKMRIGAEGYAPLFLPEGFRVCSHPGGWDAAAPTDLVRDPAEEAAVAQLVQRRRLGNRALMLLALVAALWPVAAALVEAGPGAAASRLLWLAGQALTLDVWALLQAYLPFWKPLLALGVVAAVLWVDGEATRGRIRDTALRVWRRP